MKRAFEVKLKTFFIFKGLSVAKNCLKLENPPLIINLNNKPSFLLVF